MARPLPENADSRCREAYGPGAKGEEDGCVEALLLAFLLESKRVDSLVFKSLSRRPLDELEFDSFEEEEVLDPLMLFLSGDKTMSSKLNSLSSASFGLCAILGLVCLTAVGLFLCGHTLSPC